MDKCAPYDDEKPADQNRIQACDHCGLLPRQAAGEREKRGFGGRANRGVGRGMYRLRSGIPQTSARQAANETRLITSAVERPGGTRVGQIGDISKLIRSIAAQTNLLALNATIEAAPPLVKPDGDSLSSPKR